MAYFEVAEIRDQLLKNIIVQSDVDESTNYVEDLALSYGVSPDDIPKDPPYIVRKIAMYYALMTCAQNTSRYNDEGDDVGPDAYEMKRRMYASRLSDIEGKLTAASFAGGASAVTRFPTRIPMRRC